MEQQNKILDLKNNPSVNTHLTFLQGIINRMASNSSNVKALIAVIYTIATTIFIGLNCIKQYWWIGIIIGIIGAFIDAYYLGYERIFRKKYNIFIENLNEGDLGEKEIFVIKAKNTDLKFELFAEIIDAIRSISVWLYYLLFIAISILIKII